MERKRNRRKDRISKELKGVIDFVITVLSIIGVIFGLLLYDKIISLNILLEWFN